MRHIGHQTIVTMRMRGSADSNLAPQEDREGKPRQVPAAVFLVKTQFEALEGCLGLGLCLGPRASLSS